MQIASDFTHGSDLTNQFTSLQFTNKTITFTQCTFDRATPKRRNLANRDCAISTVELRWFDRQWLTRGGYSEGVGFTRESGSKVTPSEPAAVFNHRAGWFGLAFPSGERLRTRPPSGRPSLKATLSSGPHPAPNPSQPYLGSDEAPRIRSSPRYPWLERVPPVTSVFLLFPLPPSFFAEAENCS